MSVRLYVGNLPEELNRQDLEAVFVDAGDSISTKIITDRKTNKCRGFAFVTVKTDEEADAFIEKFNGAVVKDNPIKIEKALPRTKEKGADEPSTVDLPIPNANSGKRKSNNNKGVKRTSNASSELESVQPDPRWAQELEKLKQLLATQTTNS
jgi:RNA recognition motif-containing protein